MAYAVSFVCGCGRPFRGKDGQRKLSAHIAERRSPRCGTRNTSSYSHKMAGDAKK